jgi:hypothetical protein
MKKLLFLSVLLFFGMHSIAQSLVQHYIKFVHVGQRIESVRTLNITYEDGKVPRDSVEYLNDTLKSVNVLTDQQSFHDLSRFLDKANYKMRRMSISLQFGTFKIITDGRRFYVPDISVTDYFERMIGYLKKKKADPQLITAITDNYPWIFNP